MIAPEKPSNNPKFLRVSTLCRLEADNEEEFWNIEKKKYHKDTTETSGTVQRLSKLNKSTKKPLVSNQDKGRRGRDAWGSRLSSLPW
ncbi:unnamed protein product [Eruca vesicaria subsp. sativa]|uniref:Uncharacterized protein n=1 Tax=Eruca vesicaria subsp. sativa TaxID=29727 RepID=A0ABC8IWM3_ERUVS|nr:unnamed protein product [Eruca vesicaria subsp. sativa]